MDYLILKWISLSDTGLNIIRFINNNLSLLLRLMVLVKSFVFIVIFKIKIKSAKNTSLPPTYIRVLINFKKAFICFS